MWALSQSLFVVSRLPDAGVSNNLARRVAAEQKSGTGVRPRNLVVSASVLSVAPAAMLTVLSLYPIHFVLLKANSDSISPQEVWILTVSGAVSACLTSALGIFQATLDGLGGMRSRGLGMFSANVIGLGVGSEILMSGGPGSLGVAYVALNTIQTSFVGVLALRGMSKAERGRTFPSKFNVRTLIRQMWRENLALLGIAAIRLTFEPLMKVVAGFVAPLAVVAALDLALKVTTQARVFAQSALQPILIVGARRRGEASTLRDRSLIAKVARNGAYVAFATFIFEIGSVGILADLVLGSREESFLWILLLLGVGSALNQLGLVAQLDELAGGNVSALLGLHVQMSLIVAVGAAASFALSQWWPAVLGFSIAFSYAGLKLWIRAGVRGVSWSLSVWLSTAMACAASCGYLLSSGGATSWLTLGAASVAAAVLLLVSVFRRGST